MLLLSGKAKAQLLQLSVRHIVFLVCLHVRGVAYFESQLTICESEKDLHNKL